MITLTSMLLLLPLAATPEASISPFAARPEAKTILGSNREEIDLGSRQGLERLLETGESAADRLGDLRSSSLLRQDVRDARWMAFTDREAAAEWLAERLERRASDLGFEPFIEADLPRDFPAPTPVLEIELKRYPAYRVATASMSGRGNSAFWTLFKHIKKHGIPMTAPVESTYAADARLSPRKMGFLYQNVEVGEAGPDGRVDIADVDAERVVSFGHRGNSTSDRIAAAQREILAWIDSRDDLEVAGDLRTMGYNSPMVSTSRRYFEVQIPVRRIEAL